LGLSGLCRPDRNYGCGKLSDLMAATALFEMERRSSGMGKPGAVLRSGQASPSGRETQVHRKNPGVDPDRTGGFDLVAALTSTHAVGTLWPAQADFGRADIRIRVFTMATPQPTRTVQWTVNEKEGCGWASSL
jgi:hypothetical protein